MLAACVYALVTLRLQAGRAANSQLTHVLLLLNAAAGWHPATRPLTQTQIFSLADWKVDLSKTLIELEHLPVDETSFWDETTGSTQARMERKRWRPCHGGSYTFSRTATVVQREFALCAVL